MSESAESQDDVVDIGDNLHIITIMYDTTSGDVPQLDLGDCSPWIAMTLLQTAMDTVQLMIPPVDITYKGQVVCQSEFRILDDDEDC
jgi:hypothetical protein